GASQDTPSSAVVSPNRTVTPVHRTSLMVVPKPPESCSYSSSSSSSAVSKRTFEDEDDDEDEYDTLKPSPRPNLRHDHSDGHVRHDRDQRPLGRRRRTPVVHQVVHEDAQRLPARLREER